MKKRQEENLEDNFRKFCIKLSNWQLKEGKEAKKLWDEMYYWIYEVLEEIFEYDDKEPVKRAIEDIRKWLESGLEERIYKVFGNEVGKKVFEEMIEVIKGKVKDWIDNLKRWEEEDWENRWKEINILEEFLNFLEWFRKREEVIETKKEEIKVLLDGDSASKEDNKEKKKLKKQHKAEESWKKKCWRSQKKKKESKKQQEKEKKKRKILF